jgi:cellulose biosynthesis protein BcsQ
MSDTVLIPVRPTSISLGGLPPTFKVIQYAADATGNATPTVVGLLLNEADRRTQQYRDSFKPILEQVTKGSLPKVFTDIWPASPSFAASTDANRDCRTLKERFGNNYDHARKAAIEFANECLKPQVGVAVVRVKPTIWQRLGLA